MTCVFADDYAGTSTAEELLDGRGRQQWSGGPAVAIDAGPRTPSVRVATSFEPMSSGEVDAQVEALTTMASCW
ncbi:MAG: hypothetical protein V5A18_05600, partial [Haloarculaceae archaeon]